MLSYADVIDYVFQEIPHLADRRQDHERWIRTYDALLAPRLHQRCGSDCAYLKIADVLADYFQGDAASVNFEHIFHCAHELLFTFEPTPSAVNEFRPILQPLSRFLRSRDFSTNQTNRTKPYVTVSLRTAF